MLKSVFFTARVAWCHVLIASLIGVAACDDEEGSTPVVNGGMTAGETMGDVIDPALCMTACQQLLSCDWFELCPASNLQSALNACFASCTNETVASELISDAELACDLSVVRTRSRFEAIAACDTLTPDDLCADQVCGVGFTCNPEDGLCINPCEGVECASGTMCVEGECRGPCTDVMCPEGLGCFEGDCIDLCFGVMCGENETCEPSSGQCIDQCEDVRCRNGQRCSEGVCIPACQDLICPEDEVCDANTGTCVDLCEGVRCQDGFECNPMTGRCSDVCDFTQCIDGWACDDGDCIFDDPCAEVLCPEDTVCNPNSRRCERFSCFADRFEVGSRNNELVNATPLPAQTQRLDDLTICSFDLDWYVFTLPADTSARLSARFAHNAGDLILRLYSSDNLLSPAEVSNTEDDDEYIGIEAADDDRRFYIRVSSGGGMFDQNRYSLVVEFNLPGTPCNQDSECLEDGVCINALCGGRGEINPDTTPDSTEQPDPTDPSCIDDTYEPNNSFEEATAIDQGGVNGWSATICTDDEDFYTLQITELSDIEINVLFTDAEGDLDVILFDEALDPVELSDSIDDNEQIVAEALTPGTYFIAINGFNGAENRYDLEVNVTASEGVDRGCMNDSQCRGDYVCVMGECATPAGYCEDVATPNGDYMSAYSVMIPSVNADLTLCDPDFFAIDLLEGQTVTIRVTFSNSNGEDIDMKLYRPNGMEVRVSSGLADVEEIIYTAEMAGIHTLEVFPFYGLNSSSTFIARYTLSVSEGE